MGGKGIDCGKAYLTDVPLCKKDCHSFVAPDPITHLTIWQLQTDKLQKVSFFYSASYCVKMQKFA